MNPEAKPKARFRAALFAFGLLALATALIWIWFFSESQRQDKLIRTAITGMAGYAGFLVWMLFASRWRARVRWTVFITTIAVVLFCRFCLRISGVTGDLLPIVEWRWKRTPAAVATSEPGPMPSSSLTNSYPQFLGPHRNGIVDGPELARDWKKSPPRELWRRGVGAAWSGFATQGGWAVTQEQQGENELVVCYELLSGKTLWSHADKSRYATTIAGEGPRATPTIAGDRVYTMGGAGLLNCLELKTGQALWSKDTLAQHSVKLPEWGVACSPLVTERAVIVSVGGRGSGAVAYAKESGEVLWKSGNDDPHWSSPIRVAMDGVPQILIFSENVSSYDEATGRTLWQYPWRNTYPHVSVPVILSTNRILVSQGYGAGSELIEVSHDQNRWRTQRVWKSIRLKSKFGTVIPIGAFVYGLDDGALACIDANTGDLKWKGDRYGHGQMMLVGKLLLIMAENGEVVLIEPTPDAPRELSRFKVFAEKTWNPPALAGDLLLIRNDREAACLKLSIGMKVADGRDKSNAAKSRTH